MSWLKKMFGDGEPAEKSTISKEVRRQDELVLAPVSGQAFPLVEAKDPVFANGIMGQGIAIEPTDGMVYAPFDAQVTIAFETKHAYGLKAPSGAEVLIHIGIDTVGLNGDGFEQMVKQGDFVKSGELLGTFDREKISAAGLDTTIMIIVTNTIDYTSITSLVEGSVVHGTPLLKLEI